MSLSISEKLVVEVVGHTAKVTINNPGANTWDTESLPALKDLVQKLNADPEIYALVITGEGEKFSSAGADLNLFDLDALGLGTLQVHHDLPSGGSRILQSASGYNEVAGYATIR